MVFVKCECGKDLIRISWKGKSYCWACFDKAKNEAKVDEPRPINPYTGEVY